jgi:hypothetical protein
MSGLKVLKRDVFAGGLELAELKGFDEDFLLGGGEPVADSYPKKRPTFTVDKRPVTKPGPERPGRAGKMKASNLLTDLLHGGDPHVLVISSAMKSLIAKAERHVEFLPVTIKGHAEPFFIANFLDHVACLDLEKSGAEQVNGEVLTIKKLVLRKGAVPADRALFQVKEYRDLFLVRDSLAAAFEEAGLTGMETFDIDAFVPN